MLFLPPDSVSLPSQGSCDHSERLSWNYFQTLHLLNRWRKYWYCSMEEESSMMITDRLVPRDKGRAIDLLVDLLTLTLTAYCGTVDSDQKNWTADPCSRNELPPDILSVYSMDLSGEAAVKALLSDIWPAPPRWGVSDTPGADTVQFPPEKLKAVPRGREVWASLLTSFWQPAVNQCEDEYPQIKAESLHFRLIFTI